MVVDLRRRSGQEAQNLAFFNRKADVVDGLDAAIMFDQIANFNHGLPPRIRLSRTRCSAAGVAAGANRIDYIRFPRCEQAPYVIVC
jgi:hypothetical protein